MVCPEIGDAIEEVEGFRYFGLAIQIRSGTSELSLLLSMSVLTTRS